MKTLTGAALIALAIYKSPEISKILYQGKQPDDTLMAVAMIGAGAYVAGKILRVA